MNFSLPGKTRNILMAAAAVGLLSLVGTFIMDVQYGWANLLLNAFWFTAISLAASFFVAVHYVGEGGWHVGFKRVPEAMGQYLPIGSAILLLVVLGGYFHIHHLWHWLDPEVQANDVIYNTSGKRYGFKMSFG